MDVDRGTTCCCCYLLCESDGCRTYVGVTNHLERRLHQHNHTAHAGARYTRGREWAVLCTVEGFPSRGMALSFEWWMKHNGGGHRLVGGGVRRRVGRLLDLLLASGGPTAWWWRKHRVPDGDAAAPPPLTLRWWGDPHSQHHINHHRLVPPAPSPEMCARLGERGVTVVTMVTRVSSSGSAAAFPGSASGDATATTALSSSPVRSHHGEARPTMGPT